MKDPSVSPAAAVAAEPALKPLSGPLQALSRLGSGAVAGIIGVSCTYPLDFAKTRLQKQVKLEYTGVFDCLKKVRAQAGVGGWYNGLRPNLAGIIPEKAIKLAANDQLRHMLRDEHGHLSIGGELVAGAGAGFCQVVVTTPMEIVKIRCQLTGASMGQVVSDLGLRGLYRGYIPTLSRDVWFSLWFFPMQAKMKEYLLHDTDSEGERMAKSFFAGISAGCLGAAISTPTDVIKTRVQASNGGTIPSVIRDTIREEGMSAFMKGWKPRCIAIAPLFGIAIMVYDIQKRIVRSLGYDPES
eukprot:TRINITY_DN188_c0_g1_i1.p1 TRINITY_DN188_c0_g1~~TRINITY_DN188_c0_g1_i1.p1  ORF type:complete len:298 (-),score=82.04 TRINITY_DN188_c0_g1_i1:369-1262(-)